MVLWISIFVAACVLALVVLVVLARDGLRAISTFKEVSSELDLSFAKSSRESGQMPSIVGTIDDVSVRAALMRETDQAGNARRGLYIRLSADVDGDPAADALQTAERDLATRFDHCVVSTDEVSAERWNTDLEPAELRDDLEHIAVVAATLDGETD
jgi:hypothetical protein